MGVSQNVDNTTKTFIAILSLGLVGLLFLIIFGNLSGNLGFDADSVTITNESGAYLNITGYTLAGASDVGAASFAITAVWANITDNIPYLVPAANYTVSSAGLLTNNTVVPNSTQYEAANVSYTYGRDSQPESDTNQVIGNLTGGAVSFFSFSNVWFILLAITLLIIIVISVIALVSKSGKSDFTS